MLALLRKSLVIGIRPCCFGDMATWTICHFLRRNKHGGSLSVRQPLNLIQHGLCLQAWGNAMAYCRCCCVLHLSQGLFVITNLNHLLVHPEKLLFSYLHGEPLWVDVNPKSRRGQCSYSTSGGEFILCLASLPILIQFNSRQL